MFEPWQLAAIDDAGYNGIRDEHIDRVAESLLSTGLTEIDRSTFDYHCHKCGVDPDNFTQADLDRLQEKLNEQVIKMRSAGWCAYMQSQLEREERQKEYERKRAEREAWTMEHMSSESCPLCGRTMYIREGKYGRFLGCSNYPNCKGTRKIK